MFKTTLKLVLAMICLNFSSKVTAQTPENKAVDVTAKGLQIGQKVPKTSVIAKYKGKFLILDFWATWCSPCIAMIPKMEALQEQFKDQLQIIPVTYQTEKEVTAFLTKLQNGKPSILPQITGDKELHQLFPHVYLPHYIWIDQTDTIKAITGYEELTAGNIEKMLDQTNSNLPLKQKKDMKIAYDYLKPFLLNGNGGDGATLTYHSLFTSYTEGIGMGIIITRTDSIKGKKIILRNLSPSKMLRIAFGKPGFETARMILNVKEKSLISPAFSDDVNWPKAHSSCYELIVPPHLVDQMYPIMQADLLRYFPQYTAKMQIKKVPCMVLERTSKNDKLKSIGGKPETKFGILGCRMQNFSLTRFIDQLRIIYQQKSIYPIVDGTKYNAPVDLEINANLQDFNAINKELLKYDLQFVKKDRKIQMLIIADKN
jgi:thiol-disulfide isomerase/thioredoxin